MNKKLPKIHYFEEGKADPNDHFLNMSIQQGYVPKGCLLGGQLVWGLVEDGRDPCAGCGGPIEKCGGRIKPWRDKPWKD